MTSAHPASRLRHVCGGVFVASGIEGIALCVVAAAHGLHGYLDIFSFVGSLAVCALFVAWGWAIAE